MIAWLSSPKRSAKTIILLDRDGVINENRTDYVKRFEEVSFYPDALEALRVLAGKGVEAVLISNQSGINRGLIPWDDFRRIHEGVVAKIEENGGRLLAAFYCPHRPDENCSCRKPAPGMIFDACRFAGVNPSQTYFIGDSDSDIEAAQNAGCKGIKILRDSGLEVEDRCSGVPYFRTLKDAIMSIKF